MTHVVFKGRNMQGHDKNSAVITTEYTVAAIENSDTKALREIINISPEALNEDHVKLAIQKYDPANAGSREVFSIVVNAAKPDVLRKILESQDLMPSVRRFISMQFAQPGRNLQQNGGAGRG